MKAPKPSEIKIRKTWGEMSPVTKVVKSKKLYKRKDKFKKSP